MKLSAAPACPVSAFLAAACERGKAPPPVDSSGRARRAGGGLGGARGVAHEKLGPRAPARCFSSPAASPAQAICDSAGQREPRPHSSPESRIQAVGDAVRPKRIRCRTAELPGVVDTAACSVAALSAAPPPEAVERRLHRRRRRAARAGLDSSRCRDADSAALAVEATRLASALAQRPAPADSPGLPFVVRSMWRFTVPERSTGRRRDASRARSTRKRRRFRSERSSSPSVRPTDTHVHDRLFRAFVWRRGNDRKPRRARRGVDRQRRDTPALDSSRMTIGDATAYGLIERGDDGRWRIALDERAAPLLVVVSATRRLALTPPARAPGPRRRPARRASGRTAAREIADTEAPVQAPEEEIAARSPRRTPAPRARRRADASGRAPRSRSR